ncbi:MAG: hypothetical protein ACPIOQ_62505, partial [Promethearchaeia archaeon]
VGRECAQAAAGRSAHGFDTSVGACRANAVCNDRSRTPATDRCAGCTHAATASTRPVVLASILGFLMCLSSMKASTSETRQSLTGMAGHLLAAAACALLSGSAYAWTARLPLPVSPVAIGGCPPLGSQAPSPLSTPVVVARRRRGLLAVMAGGLDLFEKDCVEFVMPAEMQVPLRASGTDAAPPHALSRTHAEHTLVSVKTRTHATGKTQRENTHTRIRQNTRRQRWPWAR